MTADYWLIADNHFGHNNIMKYENRPYKTVREMDEGMIKAWNDVVGPDEPVLFLGDFSFKGLVKYRELLDRLNGVKEFVRGNHDKDTVLERLLVEGRINEIHYIGKYIKIGYRQFHFTHFPLDIEERPLLYNVHGHIHSEPSRYKNQINVGVDSDYMKRIWEMNDEPFGTPVRLSQLVGLIEQEERENKHEKIIAGNNR